MLSNHKNKKSNDMYLNIIKSYIIYDVNIFSYLICKIQSLYNLQNVRLEVLHTASNTYHILKLFFKTLKRVFFKLKIKYRKKSVF